MCILKEWCERFRNQFIYISKFGSLLRKTSSIECELLEVKNLREERETGQLLTWLVIQLTPSPQKKISLHILHTVPYSLP